MAGSPKGNTGGVAPCGTGQAFGNLHVTLFKMRWAVKSASGSVLHVFQPSKQQRASHVHIFMEIAGPNAGSKAAHCGIKSWQAGVVMFQAMCAQRAPRTIIRQNVHSGTLQSVKHTEPQT